MNARSIRTVALRPALASGLLASLIALGLVACGGSSSSSSSAGGSGGSGGTSGTATYTVLFSFGNVSTDGQKPEAGLIQGADGNLYGTTYAGGTQGLGTVFAINPSTGAESILHSFGGASGDGVNPAALLLQGSDGNLYGTTYSGGTQNFGTVFMISPSSGAETVLYSFGSVSGDGKNPTAGLIQGSDGNLYGTAYAGGAAADGMVFAVSPTTGAETILHSFAGAPTDGVGPGSVLLQASDGTLYGTTLAGGRFNHGTIFSISPSSGAEVVLYSFGTGIDDGQDPDGSGLIQGSDGNFYGTTLQGGSHGAKAVTAGTIFMYSPGSGTETVLYSFGGFSGDGAEPASGLIRGSDGNFYGTASAGGSHQDGAVFKFSPSSGTETVLYSFGNFNGDGEIPVGGLIQTGTGNFYGTTSVGGTSNLGTLFGFTVQ